MSQNCKRNGFLVLINVNLNDGFPPRSMIFEIVMSFNAFYMLL